MACLSDETWVSSMLSKRLSIQEGKEDGVKEEETTNSFASDSTNFPFEKVFPVYAMGFLKPESDPVLLPADSRDPIWDAVREEAKIEVTPPPPGLFIILVSFDSSTIFSWRVIDVQFQSYFFFIIINYVKFLCGWIVD